MTPQPPNVGQAPPDQAPPDTPAGGRAMRVTLEVQRGAYQQFKEQMATMAGVTLTTAEDTPDPTPGLPSEMFPKQPHEELAHGVA